MSSSSARSGERAPFRPSPRRQPPRQTIGGLNRPVRRPPPPVEADPFTGAEPEQRLMAALLLQAAKDAGLIRGGSQASASCRLEARAWLRSEACASICAWLQKPHTRVLDALDALEADEFASREA